jgi:hypothetical protein
LSIRGNPGPLMRLPCGVRGFAGAWRGIKGKLEEWSR